MLKKVDETWPSSDVCVKNVCAFDTNGSAIIKEQRETCKVVCQAVSLSWAQRQAKLHYLCLLIKTGPRAEADTGQMLRSVRENQVHRRPQALRDRRGVDERR